MGSKEKICKCGHNNISHKNKNSKLSIATFFSQCPCSSYMNRKRPFKSDYAFLIATMCLAAITIPATIMFLLESDPKLDGTENTLITFTAGELYEIMFLVIMFADFFIFVTLIVDPVMDIIKAKHRREFPLGDPDAKL